MNFEVIEQEIENAKIKVVGVGGGGGNAVLHMINHNIAGVDFICANTDTQALSATKNAITLKLGNGLTKGLGAGADPDIGRRAAESDRMAIEELLTGADMVFITAGMGGGTDGASPLSMNRNRRPRKAHRWVPALMQQTVWVASMAPAS